MTEEELADQRAFEGYGSFLMLIDCQVPKRAIRDWIVFRYGDIKEPAESGFFQLCALHSFSKKFPMKTEKEFIESMSESDSLIDHSVEECGLCCHNFIMAEVAREIRASGDFDGAVKKWSKE